MTSVYTISLSWLHAVLTSCALILPLLFASACMNNTPQNLAADNNPADEPVRRMTNDAPVSEPLVISTTSFACDLYQQLSRQEGNLFLSPYSISTALAMTFAGARGETERQMAKTLHFTLPQPDLHPAYAVLQNNLRTAQQEGTVTLLTANSLWPSETYPLIPAFLDTVNYYYHTRITALDYINHSTEARMIINSWVEDATKDKIKDLIKPGMLDKATKLVLANAIYFKGTWSAPFEKNATRELPFFVSPDKSLLTPLMYQKNKFPYFENQQVQVLELPYAGDRLSMVIILPKKPGTLSICENSITFESLTTWIAKLRNIDVSIWLPKFSMTVEFNLVSPLQQLGMSDAFSPGTADFSGMDGSRNLFISAVVHKAFVEVHEQGTEAAAATGVTMALTSISRTTEFRADHPFVFLIRDRKTKSILFMGRLLNPAG